MGKKLVKGGFLGLLIYLGYVLITGNLMLLFKKPKREEGVNNRTPSDFYSTEEAAGPDKAAFFDSQHILLPLHLNLIDSAEASIKFANFSIDDGTASDLFYGKLLEAADRGVEVFILFDGKGHNLYGISNSKYWALMAHPKINLAFYEEFDWLRPWTWHNRMHDKYMIIDKHAVVTGGVNIEDAFFVEEPRDAVYDRNVVILNDYPERYEESVLKQYTDYFDSVWFHPYTSIRPSYIMDRYQKQAETTHQRLLDNLREAEKNNRHGAGTAIDWETHMYPTRKVSLVTNGIQRWKKDPHILKLLGQLFDEAEESILFQSPYVVPSKGMREYVSFKDTKASIYFLTNSLATSTNYFALSGQRKYLQQLNGSTAQIYHFQGEGYIHAKAYLFDRRLSLVGSFNFDPRSSFLSTENLVVIDSPEFAAALEESMKDLARSSVPYKKNGSELVSRTAKKAHVPWYKKGILGLFYAVFYPMEDLL